MASKPKPTFAVIADELGETETQPRGQLRAIVDALGDDAAQALLAEVQQIEADGGMLLPDGSRRRTPGGVFFHLAFARLTLDQRRKIYRRRSQQAPSDAWAERAEWIAEARNEIEEATTVKVTLVGTFSKTVEKQHFTRATLKHTPRLNTLPKGIPRPQAHETQYTVYVGGKQWRKIKDALRNPDDIAIVEGVQMRDDEYRTMTVFATNITTKLTQQARRAAQQAQAQEQA
jgi:hypothetical protein